MGDFSGPISGCLKIVVVIIVIVFLGIMAITYNIGKSEGTKDAASKTDSTILKK